MLGGGGGGGGRVNVKYSNCSNLAIEVLANILHVKHGIVARLVPAEGLTRDLQYNTMANSLSIALKAPFATKRWQESFLTSRKDSRPHKRHELPCGTKFLFHIDKMARVFLAN